MFLTFNNEIMCSRFIGDVKYVKLYDLNSQLQKKKNFKNNLFRYIFIFIIV